MPKSSDQMSNLFESMSIDPELTIPNRIVMGPMTLNQATPEGYVTPWIVEWYRKRAAGGFGAIIGAAAFVSQSGRGWENAAGIADDSYMEGWRECVRAAQDHGALFGTQLFHAGAASRYALLGHQPISASEWARPGFDPAREMTEFEIQTVINDFASAALRSVEAGCDFVELHGAHGYLIHQFWRGDVNLRKDKWGELTAFPVAVVEAVRRAIGPGIPIFYRFSVHADDPNAENSPVTPTSLKEFVAILESAGVDVWDISCWQDSKRGYFGSDVWLPDWVKKYSKKPRIVAGNLLTPDDASNYLIGGHAEFVALARAAIADAEWVNKAKSGRSSDIRPYTNEMRELLNNGIDPAA